MPMLLPGTRQLPPARGSRELVPASSARGEPGEGRGGSRGGKESKARRRCPGGAACQAVSTKAQRRGGVADPRTAGASLLGSRVGGQGAGWLEDAPVQCPGVPVDAAVESV